MVTGAAVSEGTHSTPHPIMPAACATFWLIDIPIVIHTIPHPTSIIASHPTLSTSPTDATHATFLQTGAGLPQQPPPHYRGNTVNEESQAVPKIFNTPLDSTILRLLSSRIPLQILAQIQPVTLILLTIKTHPPVVMKMNGEGNLQVPITP